MQFWNTWKNSNRGVIAWNTTSQFVGKIINSGAMFVITLLIAHTYGVQVYGDFTKITTYIAFYYLLSDFGLNAIYLQKEKEENLWGALLGLRLVGSLLLVFLSLAVLSFLPQGTSQGYTNVVRLGIILFSPAIIFQAILTSANAMFQKHLRYDLSTIATGIGSVVSLVLVFIVTGIIASSVGSVFSSLALLAGATVTALSALFFVKKLQKTITLSFNTSSMKLLFVAAIPLGLTLLFNQVYFRIDSFVLTLTRATSEVGLYGLAYKVFEVVLVVPTFFMNAVYPLMLKIENKESGMKNQELMRLVKHSFLFLLLTSLFLILVLWFAAPLLSLIRPEFNGSISALRILSLGLPFFFLSSLTMWTLIALKKQKILVAIYGVSMIFTSALDILFIPRFGYIWAAWITVFSEAVVLLFSIIALVKSTNKKFVTQ